MSCNPPQTLTPHPCPPPHPPSVHNSSPCRSLLSAPEHSQDTDKLNTLSSGRTSRSDSLSSWLPKHDARLRRLAAAASPTPDWKDIARQMQHWSARQCEARFNKLSNQANEAGGKSAFDWVCSWGQRMVADAAASYCDSQGTAWARWREMISSRRPTLRTRRTWHLVSIRIRSYDFFRRVS